MLTGDEDIFPPGPASPSHPVQRKLYENASEAAATSDAEDEEQSQGGDNRDHSTGCVGKSITRSSPNDGGSDVCRSGAKCSGRDG